ncbi:MAG: hypothetical protein PHC85_02525 [Candidatus Pacebacteria bacterium]|nr:hypothetical protein [Candidatus Paceibacterota bacterium]
MNKPSLRVLFFVLIFCFSFFVWYSPVLLKGYAPYKIKDSILLARNIEISGVYGYENGKNVILAPSLAKDSAEQSLAGNRLTAFLYSRVFSALGFLSPGQLVLFSIFLNSSALVVFSIIVSRLFGFKLTALFSSLYVLAPFNWQQIYSIGSYEFAIFFVSLFFAFFILGRDNKRENFFLAVSGIFLALAVMAKEAFFLLIPLVFLYLWFSRGRRFVAPFLVPLILILSVFYVPSFFKKDGGNVYSKLFFAGSNQEKKFLDFENYGHLYPDPYTYHFEKGEFLKNYKEQIENTGFFGSLQMKKVLANVGERGVGIGERFFLGCSLAFGHMEYFLSLEKGGGPFFLFFAILGLFFVLKKRDRELYRFSLFWTLGTLSLLSFVVLASRTHMVDFCWLLPLLSSLGVFYLLSVFKEQSGFSGKKFYSLSFFLIFVSLFNLYLANRLAFGLIYGETNSVLKIEDYARRMKDEKTEKDITAVGFGLQDSSALNYLSEKSLVIFNPETVERLIEENKLKEAFDYFEVDYVLGYNDVLSEKIFESSGIKSFPLKAE